MTHEAMAGTVTAIPIGNLGVVADVSGEPIWGNKTDFSGHFPAFYGCSSKGHPPMTTNLCSVKLEWSSMNERLRGRRDWNESSSTERWQGHDDKKRRREWKSSILFCGQKTGIQGEATVMLGGIAAKQCRAMQRGVKYGMKN